MNMELVSRFRAIDLDSLDRVKLMERMDQKFLVPLKQLAEIFLAIERQYYVLEINKERILRYQTHYFDTKDDSLYTSHHNGKLNRYKVRKRTYLDTHTSFFEIKFKNNKRKTFKRRIKNDEDQTILNVREKEFVLQNSPIDPDDLHSKSMNQFRRITLTDKKLTERCTIDIGLQFKSKHQTTLLDSLAIIEIKQDRHSQSSALNHYLSESRISPIGFSKYCIGRALAEEDLKSNAFKAKIRLLNKLTD
nr:polyphosphate polymerase domain-containing protein [Sunxiuqinia sp.]